MQRSLLFSARRRGPATGMRFFSASASRPAINKIVSSAQEAIKDMKSDSTVLVGGFGFSGVPNTLINALRDRSDLTNFTVVSNNAGMPGVGLGQLLETKQIGKESDSKYGGLIYTSQRAVEAFSKLVSEGKGAGHHSSFDFGII